MARLNAARLLAALAAGLVFGLGLAVSHMVEPAKVLGFLDIAGAWDPSLALVMAAAIPVAALGFWLGRRRGAPWFAGGFAGPMASAIDLRLIGGAILFGIGWGLAGLCPGPALASLFTDSRDIALFVGGMLWGMAGFQLLAARGGGR